MPRSPEEDFTLEVRVMKRHNVMTILILSVLLLLGLVGGGLAQKDKGKESKESKKSKKKASGAPTHTGTPAIWTDRGDVSALDLKWGIGSEEDLPKPPFTFDKEDVSGTNPKVRIKDANGTSWNIKFDEEVHAEVAASRIVWACGYMVEESYFIPSGTIAGVGKLGRAGKFVSSGGNFSNGMFEKRPDDVAKRGIFWTWDSNPFHGTKELSGLVILNALLNNWDAKNVNNNVLGMYDADGQTVKEWYIVADWGGTFGKMGGFMSHNKWDLDAFQKQAFLDGVSGGQLKLHYSGKMSGMSSVPIDHARWFAGIIGQLSQEQIRQAFQAAGATPSEVDGFSRKIMQKIGELKSAAGR